MMAWSAIIIVGLIYTFLKPTIVQCNVYLYKH